MERVWSRTESKRRELRDVLRKNNAIRAFFSSVCMAVAIPIMLLIVQFTGMYGENGTSVKICLATFEGIQLVLAGLGYYLNSNNETDKYGVYYVFNYFISMISIGIIAAIDLKLTGNILFFALDCLYFLLVPVLDTPKRRCFMYTYSGIGFILCVLCGKGARPVVNFTIMAAIMIAASTYLHNKMIEYEKLNIRFREKSISAEKDPLTGLTNRRGLGKKTGALWPYCSRNAISLGMIEIDIDFFKKYNDKFGHPAGDKCLKMVADAIRKSAVRSSDITARIGGEEFLVFVQNMDEQEMIALAMKIRNNIAELKIPHAYVNISPYITVSMGIGIMTPDNKKTIQELYELTDKALYDAKTNGRNCIVCSNKIYGRMKNGFATVIAQ